MVPGFSKAKSVVKITMQMCASGFCALSSLSHHMAVFLKDMITAPEDNRPNF